MLKERELCSTERPALFLGQQEQCLLTGERNRRLDGNDGIPLTIDHLIPRLAARKHRILRPLLEKNENLVCLCHRCHHKIDHRGEFGKMMMYRKLGLPGLVEYLARYPRSPVSNLYVIQYHQFRELFGMVVQVINDAEKDKKLPPHLLSQYTSARDIALGKLYYWERGDF